jgi:hypothetical protein
VRIVNFGTACASDLGSATSNRGAGRSQAAHVNYYGARNGLLALHSHARAAKTRPLAVARLMGPLLAAEGA